LQQFAGNSLHIFRGPLFQFDSILSGFVGLSSRSVLVLSKYFPLSDLD